MSDATATGLYAQMELAPGTVIAGRFRIEGLIGIGGMGVVYRAVDEALSIPVAIKLLRPELALRPDSFDRFRQELLLARQVSSPHVVRIHDIARHEFGDGEARWLISMDLIDGEALDHRLDRGALPVDEALRIARQVALGLEAAHARGVIHRDLKPANVLIDAAGNAYISDFGVARSLSGSTRSATVGIVGTPDYLSPEQARGDPVGPRSDLYALGLMLHEMLTGERAFSSATAAEALAQRLVSAPPLVTTLRPDAPQWVARLVERLLRPQPAHRLPDAAAVVQAIDRRELPRDPLARRRWGIVLAVSLATVAAGAAGVAWWMQRSDAPIVAPAPSRPLDRLLVLPLQGAELAEDRRVGLDTHLRAAFAQVPAFATVDGERTWQAMRQLGTAGQPSAADARESAAATRVLRIGLRRDASGWRGSSELVADSRTEQWTGPAAGTPERALQDWLAADDTRRKLAMPSMAPLPLPAPDTVAQLGRAEAARRANRYDLALDQLRASLSAESRDAVGWMTLAEVAQAIGDRDGALAAIEQARRAVVPGADRLVRRLQAEQALLEGDTATAVSQWRVLLAQTPEDTFAELQLARAQGAGGDFDAAIATLRRLTARDAQDARAWFELGKFSLLQGDARRAVEDYLLRSLVLFKRSRNTYGEAEAVNALGIGYGRLGQTGDAEEQYRRAVALRRAVGNRRGVATSLRNLANLQSQRGAFDEAEKALSEARALHVALDDRSGLAALDNERGLLAEERGDYRSALEAFRLALRGSERAGDPHGVAEAINNIGFAHYQLGAYEDAQASWLRAADSYRVLGAHTGLIRTGQNLGLLATARGRWDEAQRRQEEALAQAQRQQMTEEAAVSHRNLAELALARGDLVQSIEQAGRAEALFRERDDLRGSIDARLLRIDALLAAGAATAANAALDALRSDLDAASTEQRAIARRLEAELALDRRDTRTALAALRTARGLAEASGVRQLQLEIALLEARALERDIGEYDAPTATLGHAGVRLDWLEAALGAAVSRGDGAAATRLYGEATGWLRGTHSPQVVRIHALGARARVLSGDAAGAREAQDAERDAAAALARARPAEAAAPAATRPQPPQGTR
jgi:tetratricopeptide (TPR) repeat protein